MKTLLEIEEAIQHLPESDIRQLSEWLQSHLEKAWDHQLEMDFDSGKLDHLIARAEADISASRVKYLDEILDNV
ncbi:MAG: hypothetical protein MH252_01180 [Thermosynechococcaceae cyanobacterium MS004]|nr:hypothetical protein [Thermosynechococcaceae cyanobacterium MS004]